MCLKCGSDDPYEYAIGMNYYEPCTGVWDKSPEAQKVKKDAEMGCPIPDRLYQYGHEFDGYNCKKCGGLDLMAVAILLKYYDPDTEEWEDSPAGRAFESAWGVNSYMGCPVARKENDHELQIQVGHRSQKPSL
jgi:hypothetical protein